MLLNSTSDTEETVYLKKNSIDRSIGYLVGGVVVLLFFLTYLVGLGRVQSMSDQAVGVNRAEPAEKSAEINDSADSPAAKDETAR